MTTYQQIQKETGAPMAVVKAAKLDIIGNRHTMTTPEYHRIIKRINQYLKEEGEMYNGKTTEKK